MNCKYCKIYFKKRTKWYGDTNQFCSSRCALAICRTKKHQREAGKKGALTNILRYRGTGTKGYIKENQRNQHCVVMERMLGRKLKKGEVVHHKDENKKNNKPSNLQLFKNQAEHARHHMLKAKRNKKGYLLKCKTTHTNKK